MKKIFFLFLILLCACAPSRLIKPLGKGQSQISFNLGGPLIKYGTSVIPIPLTSVSYARGLNEQTSVFGALHITSLLFKVPQIELGVLRNLVNEQKTMPGISGSLVANTAMDFNGNFKFWPQLDVNAYKTYGVKKHFVYLGLSNWFELSSKRAFDEKQEHRWLPSPQLGNTFNTDKWAYTLEVKYLVPYISKEPNVVTYIGPGSKGAMGVYLNISRRF